MITQLENWMTITDFPDYLVSDRGQIKSLKHGKQRVLKPSVSAYGYHVVNLWGPMGVKKQFKVHRLVCHAFNGAPPLNKPFVNHKDGIKLNNVPSNLEWSDKEENNTHAVKTGLRGATYDILVTDIVDGEVYHYNLVKDVLAEYNLKVHVLEGLIKGFPHKTLNRHNGSFTFQALYREENKGTSNRGVVVKNCLSGEEYITDSLRIAAHKTGLSRFIISKKKDTNEMVNGFLFKSLVNLKPFPEIPYTLAKASQQAYVKHCKDNNL